MKSRDNQRSIYLVSENPTVDEEQRYEILQKQLFINNYIIVNMLSLHGS